MTTKKRQPITREERDRRNGLRMLLLIVIVEVSVLILLVAGLFFHAKV
jgi:hypothetical protein